MAGEAGLMPALDYLGHIDSSPVIPGELLFFVIPCILFLCHPERV